MSRTKSWSSGSWSSTSWSSPPDPDWIRVSTLAAGGLAVLYAVLVPAHLVRHEGDAHTVLPVLAGLSAVLLGAAALAARRRPELAARWWWLPLLAGVPLVNGLTLLGTSGQLEQTTTEMLVFVAIGGIVGSRRVAAALIAAGTLAWVVVVAATVDTDHQPVMHYAVALAAAIVVAGCLHAIRGMREQRLRRTSAQHLGERTAHLQRIADHAGALAASEARYRGLFDASPVGISLSDERGLFVTANPALCALLGREEHELLGRSAVDFTYDGDTAIAASEHAHTLITAAPDGVVQLEKRFVRPDGSTVWALLTVRHTEGPRGEVWTLAHVLDITERRDAEAELRGLETDLAAIATVARRIRTGEPARPAVVQAARDVVGAHAVHLCEPSGPDALTVTSSSGRDLVGTRVPLDETSMTARVFRTGEAVFLSDPASHPSVSPRLHAMSGGESMAWQPVVVGGVVIAVLVSTWGVGRSELSPRRREALALLADEAAVALEHERVLGELQRRADTDALTGLPNRRTWDNQLAGLLARARRFDTGLTVAIADLDRFKAFNDAYGHPAGDAHLQTFAVQARRALREVDVMARWGGEEFAIALPECDTDVAERALERVRAAVPGGQTCSIGCATWDGVETSAGLLARADEALYRAKSAGRDRLVVADCIPRPRHG